MTEAKKADAVEAPAQADKSAQVSSAPKKKFNVALALAILFAITTLGLAAYIGVDKAQDSKQDRGDVPPALEEQQEKQPDATKPEIKEPSAENSKDFDMSKMDVFSNGELVPSEDYRFYLNSTYNTRYIFYGYNDKEITLSFYEHENCEPCHGEWLEGKLIPTKPVKQIMVVSNIAAFGHAVVVLYTDGTVAAANADQIFLKHETTLHELKGVKDIEFMQYGTGYVVHEEYADSPYGSLLGFTKDNKIHIIDSYFESNGVMPNFDGGEHLSS